jgi:hypothetical protein
MIYSSLLHAVTSPAYYGLDLDLDLDPYPATPRSNPSAPTRQSRPSTNVYFASLSSRGPQTQTSCHEHVVANCCLPCPHARASPVAGLRWHPPPRHQRPRRHPLAHYVKHLYVLFFFFSQCQEKFREWTVNYEREDALRLSPLSRSSISFLLRSRSLSFSSCTCFPIFFPSRSRRRASLFAIPALSSSRRCRMRSMCASVLTISAKKSSGRVNGRLCLAARARAAFAPCKACL